MRWLHLAVVVVLAAAVGCQRSADEVVVYTALDREFSEPVLERFSAETGIDARAKYDVESTKTVGLTQAIISERDRPRCDVFWNNEILNTLRLKKLGLLEAYQSPSAAPYPATFKAADGTWHGFAGRARIILVNKELLDERDWPTSIHDFAHERYRGKAGIAKPLFGTTATHVACLFATMGSEPAKELLLAMKENQVQILGGNKQVAEAVSSGQILFGLTDTDDAIVEIDQGKPVEIIYPDQDVNDEGTLFIPNTVAIVRGGPNPEGARRLVDFVLSPASEAQLAEGGSSQIPLNPEVSARPRVKTPAEIKALEVDFEAAAERWESAMQFVERELLAP